jgi:hypothetical protein
MNSSLHQNQIKCHLKMVATAAYFIFSILNDDAMK